MAQGKLNLTKKKAKRVSKKPKGPHTFSARNLQPKKLSVREREAFKLKKKERGHFSVLTEKAISAKVGHLEILKGTRRQLEKAAKK